MPQITPRYTARDSVYWPQINKDIENLVKTCEICQENVCRNNKDPAIPREVPVTPWLTIEIDLFMLDDHSFLLAVDMTSQVPSSQDLEQRNMYLCTECTKGYLL